MIDLHLHSNDRTSRGLFVVLALLITVSIILAFRWPGVWLAAGFFLVVEVLLAGQVLLPYEMNFEVDSSEVRWTIGRGKLLVVRRSDVRMVDLFGGNEGDFSRLVLNDETSARLPGDIFTRLAVEPLPLAREWQRLWPEKVFFVHNGAVTAEEDR